MADYRGTAAFGGDYVVWKHGTSGRWFVDRVNADQSSMLIGAAKGYEVPADALREAAREAHRRGELGDAQFFHDDGTGSLYQYDEEDVYALMLDVVGGKAKTVSQLKNKLLR
jgi:hypothetical protein